MDGEIVKIEVELIVGNVLRNQEEAILALENGFYSLNIETEKITLIDEPEKHLPNNRFNDGKCDAYGRFWAGTMNKFYAIEGATYTKIENNAYLIKADADVVKINVKNERGSLK